MTDCAIVFVAFGVSVEDTELTTQKFAAFLNVSRQYVVQLLDQGAIPHTKVGTDRRVRFGDLQAYKEVRDGQRRAGLARLTRLSEDLGMYDEDFPAPTTSGGYAATENG